MKSELSRIAMTIVFTIALCANPWLAKAQTTQPPKANTSSSAHQLLASFEKRAETGPASLGTLLRQPERYNKKVIDSVVVGLERLALASSSPSVRSNAAWNLAIAGSANLSDPALLNRLVRLYDRSNDDLVRRSILAHMYEQRNKPAAIQFLMRVASETPNHQAYEGAALEAVSGLSYMGEDGRAALVQLRKSGRLKDPSAIGYVDWFFTTHE